MDPPVRQPPQPLPTAAANASSNVPRWQQPQASFHGSFADWTPAKGAYGLIAHPSPDISLATSTLGWSPSIQLSDGLSRTIAYFKALLA